MRDSVSSSSWRSSLSFFITSLCFLLWIWFYSWPSFLNVFLHASHANSSTTTSSYSQFSSSLLYCSASSSLYFRSLSDSNNRFSSFCSSSSWCFYFFIIMSSCKKCCILGSLDLIYETRDYNFSLNFLRSLLRSFWLSASIKRWILRLGACRGS